MVSVIDPRLGSVVRRRRRPVRRRLKRKKTYPNEQFPFKSEAAFQMAAAKFITENIRGDVLWTAFPAGGGGRNRGAMLKAMGLQPGWPDLIFVKNGLFYSLELKTPTGRLSPAQEVFSAVTAITGRSRVARSLLEVHDALSHWKLLKNISEVIVPVIGAAR